MLQQAIPAGAENVTVTDTATSLLALIRTAASITSFEFDPVVNYVVLQVSSASASGVRYALSSTPTASAGIEITAGNSVSIPARPEDILLIRTGASDATVSVEVFKRQAGSKES